MKESNRMLEKRLKRAMESIVPEVSAQFFEQIEKRGDYNQMSDTAVMPTKGSIPKSTDCADVGTRLQRFIVMIAASFMLLLGSYSGYMHYFPQSVINFDVNPSIELSVNRAEKVLKVTPLNEDARIIVGDMNLKNVDLDIAVNALVGSMVKNNYIDEKRNSILITVNSKDAEKGVQLQKRLSDEVNTLLDSYAVKGAILSQTSKADNHIRHLSEKYGISTGKASLIEQLVKKDPTIQYADVAALPINDINLLIAKRYPDLQGVSSSGQASTKGYIGEDRAKEIALNHAGVMEADLRSLEIELDYDDGCIIYEIEFYCDDVKYEYEMDALNGRILEFKIKDKLLSHTGASANGPSSKTSTPAITADAAGYIGRQNAVQIALKHAGISAEVVQRIKSELDYEDGYVVYEVEFKHMGREYEYDINALTGEIMKWETELKKGD